MREDGQKALIDCWGWAIPERRPGVREERLGVQDDELPSTVDQQAQALLGAGPESDVVALDRVVVVVHADTGFRQRFFVSQK